MCMTNRHLEFLRVFIDLQLDLSFPMGISSALSSAQRWENNNNAYFLNIICKQVALLQKIQFSEMSTGLRTVSHMVPGLPLTSSVALTLGQTQLPSLSNRNNNCSPGHHTDNYSCADSRRHCQINEEHYCCFIGLQKFYLLG